MMRPLRVRWDWCAEAPGYVPSVQLPKQVALYRAGIRVECVLIYQTGQWWFDVSMMDNALHEWLAFVDARDDQLLNDLNDAQVLVMQCFQHDWPLRFAVTLETLHDFIAWMPKHDMRRQQVDSELDQLGDDLYEWAADNRSQSDLWSRVKVEQLTLDEQRFRWYYSYEIWADGQPIYVGKGKGSRCAEHLEKPTYQCYDELCIHVYRHNSNAAACADELRRVQLIGLENLKNKIMPSGRPSA